MNPSISVWHPDFGEGITIQNKDTGDAIRASAQRALGALPSGSGMLYEDTSGRLAVLEGLSSDEVRVLQEKHFGTE